MLKLHPTQLAVLSIIPPSPSLKHKKPSPPPIMGAKNPNVYKERSIAASSHNGGVVSNEGVASELPELGRSDVFGFDKLNECVQREGLLAYYVATSVTSIGSRLVTRPLGNKSLSNIIVPPLVLRTS